jgi:hypothetical protein
MKHHNKRLQQGVVIVKIIFLDGYGGLGQLSCQHLDFSLDGFSEFFFVLLSGLKVRVADDSGFLPSGRPARNGLDHNWRRNAPADRGSVEKREKDEMGCDHIYL